MKVDLEQLEEMQKELFKQQCDLDIQKAMVKHFIKKEKDKQLTLTDVVSSTRYKTDEYLVYTPSDDESVVVIEDTFKTQKTVDIKDFNNLMSVLHSVQDY